jgi:hypothetical protein
MRVIGVLSRRIDLAIRAAFACGVFATFAFLSASSFVLPMNGNQYGIYDHIFLMPHL